MVCHTRECAACICARPPRNTDASWPASFCPRCHCSSRQVVICVRVLACALCSTAFLRVRPGAMRASNAILAHPLRAGHLQLDRPSGLEACQEGQNFAANVPGNRRHFLSHDISCCTLMQLTKEVPQATGSSSRALRAACLDCAAHLAQPASGSVCYANSSTAPMHSPTQRLQALCCWFRVTGACSWT